MNTAMNIGKGLLQLVWGLLKITVVIADAVINASDHGKKTPRYNKLDAIELYQKCAISPQDYKDATRLD